MIIQLTGLSKSGKSTISNEVKTKLDLLGIKCEIIDGDEYRKSICNNLGFSKEDRIENIRRLHFIAKKFSDQKIITLIAAINPYEDIRNEIESKIVYLKAVGRELEMYKDSEYEVPSNPILIINTIEDVSISVNRVVNLILDNQTKTIPKALFIGRWQPWHSGHSELISNKLGKGIPVLIAVRDILPDEKNPFTTFQTIDMIKTVYQNESLVTVVSIPDIESVNYGRGVGYEINEFVLDSKEHISASKIREEVRTNQNNWKNYVDTSIHSKVLKYLRPIV